MGCIQSKNKNIPDYDKFCPLRITSIYADIDESINKSKKINTIVEYFLKSFYGFNLDVLCIQGIRSHKILKEIVRTFKMRIEKYNDENYNYRIGYESALYLEYYPDIDFDIDNDSGDEYWSTSEYDDSIEYFDKLIVTRHTILQSFSHVIDSNVESKKPVLGLNNNESDENIESPAYIQSVNINIDGTFVSIYNLELEDDNIGINNKSVRRKQLFTIKNLIEDNRRKISVNSDMRKFTNGDNTFLACDRDIHILTGMFHINELKNNSINSEYSKTLNILEALDIHQWITTLKKDTNIYPTNIRMTRDSYIFLSSSHLKNENDILKKSMAMFKHHKMVITSSNIMRNQVDMSQFNNYPLDILLMLYKPDIKTYSTSIGGDYRHRQNIPSSVDYRQKRPSITSIDDRNSSLKKNRWNRSSTTHFMDQIKEEVANKKILLNTGSFISNNSSNSKNNSSFKNPFELKIDTSKHNDQEKKIKLDDLIDTSSEGSVVSIEIVRRDQKPNKN